MLAYLFSRIRLLMGSLQSLVDYTLCKLIIARSVASIWKTGVFVKILLDYFEDKTGVFDTGFSQVSCQILVYKSFGFLAINLAIDCLEFQWPSCQIIWYTGFMTSILLDYLKYQNFGRYIARSLTYKSFNYNFGRLFGSLQKTGIFLSYFKHITGGLLRILLDKIK